MSLIHPWYSLLGVCLVLSLVSAESPNSTLYTLKNGVCERPLNESRHNSPDDCPLTTSEITGCLNEKDSCVDDTLFRDIHIFLFLVLAGLALYRYREKFWRPKNPQDRYRKIRHMHGQRRT